MKTYRSIYLIILISCSCTGGGFSWAENDRRVFLSADGRRIEGTLTGFNADDQTAEIARSDGKQFQVRLERFSAADQRYIRKQSAQMNFMQSLKITPKLRKLNAAGRFDDTRYKAEHVKSLGYVIALENSSPTPLERIVIEYCLFYRQGERRGNAIDYLHGVQFGRCKLGSIAPGSRHILETESVLIHDTGSKCTLFGNDSRAQGGVEGIWLRITATLPNGDRVLRDLQSSSLTDNHHNWVTTSIPVGLNMPRVSLAHY